MCKKFFEFYQKHEINFDKKFIFLGLSIFGLIFFIASVYTISRKYNEEEYIEKDENVYLNEEVCYAGGIYIKASSISVDVIDSQINEMDEDDDELSKYSLNLGLSIERRSNTKQTKNVRFSVSSFSLKNVNLEAKSKMSVFLECLAKESISLLFGMTTGSVNLINETINFVGEYTTDSIENAQFKTDFRKIKCQKNSFEPFELVEMNKIYNVDLRFPIKKEYTESKNIIVLSIDHWNHIEKKIFLTTRPVLK